MSNLKMIKDEPWFISEESEVTFDAFNHEVFADILLSTIKDNDPPLTIGLFGGWGVGKSSIINLLKNKIALTKINFATVYFNAWAYSDDSFRRQFLLTLVKDLIKDESDRKKEVDRLMKLNYAKILEELPGESLKSLWNKARATSGFGKTILDEIKSAFERVKLADIGLIRVVLSFTFFVVSALLFAVGIWRGDNEIQRWSIFSFALSAANFFAPKIESIFIQKRTEVFDAKLIFPEQFEKEYISLIDNYAANYEKVVVVIDDLDRCDSDTIKKVLITLKNFLGKNKTIFIVPLDDSAVVRMFQGENYNFGYEQLRKYFSVSIRIPELYHEDLIDFAERIAKDYNIFTDVALIAALGYCNDARKMKHFLNLYKIKVAIATKRKESGFLQNINIEEMSKQIAKLVVLEYQYPEFYRFITKYPQAIDEFTKNAIDSNIELNGYHLNEINEKYESINDVWKNSRGLAEFLKRTSNIAFENIEVLSKMKITNHEQEISQIGIKINELILNSQSKDLDSSINYEFCQRYGSQIASVIKKNLNSTSSLVVKSSTNFTLNLLSAKYLDPRSTNILFNELVRVAITPSSGFTLNNSSFFIFLDYFKTLNSLQKNQLLAKIRADFEATNFTEYEIDKIFNNDGFIDLLKYDPEISEIITQKVTHAVINENNIEKKIKIITSINNIRYSKKEREKLGLIIPGQKLLVHLVSEINEEDNNQNMDLEAALVEIILNESNPCPFEELDPYISSKLNNIVSKNITSGKLNNSIQKAYDIVYRMPTYLESPFDNNIGSNIIGNYNRYTNDDDKIKLLFILFICIESISDNNQRSAAYDNYFNFVNILPSESLNKHFLQIERGIGEEYYKKRTLIDIVARLWNEIKANYKSVAKDKIIITDYLFDHKSFPATENKVAFIKQLVTTTDHNSLSNWFDFIKRRIEHLLFEDKVMICKTLLERVKDSSIGKPLRMKYFDLFLCSLELADDLRDPFKNEFPILLNSLSNESDYLMYEMVTSNFDRLLNLYGNSVPKAQMPSIINSLFAVKNLEKYPESLKICMKYKESLTQSNWEQVADKIITELFNNELNIDYRMALLRLGEEIPQLTNDTSQFSRVLHEFKEHGDNNELKAKTEELYNLLTGNNVIDRYKEYPIDSKIKDKK